MIQSFAQWGRCNGRLDIWVPDLSLSLSQCIITIIIKGNSGEQSLPRSRRPRPVQGISFLFFLFPIQALSQFYYLISCNKSLHQTIHNVSRISTSLRGPFRNLHSCLKPNFFLSTFSFSCLLSGCISILSQAILPDIWNAIALRLWPAYYTPEVTNDNDNWLMVVTDDRSCSLSARFNYQAEWFCPPLCTDPYDHSPTCDECREGLQVKVWQKQ